MRKLIAIWLAFFCMAGAGAMLAQTAPAAGAEAEQHAESARYAEVTTEKGTLNLRTEPKDSAKVLKRLERGSIVQILGDYGDWTEILYGERSGYVMSKFLTEIEELPYPLITKEDTGDAVLAFKRAMHQLGYLKSEEINTRFDMAMELALTKMQLMNGVALNPEAVTPELQALVEWGKIVKAKSGYLDTATDQDSGLTVSIFCWDSAGTLYEADKSVKLKISFAAQATGGVPPYTITVKKSLGGGEAYGDEVTSPFSHIWSPTSDCLYVYATAVDAAGNTVTACAPFRYTLPSQYR